MKQTKGLPQHPYVGLRSFASAEEKVFIGRDKQIADLLSKMGFNRFVAVLGASGVGKSSLLRAGLLPKLRAGFDVGGRKTWACAFLRPGDAPVDNLAAALLQVQKGDTDKRSAEAVSDSIRQGQMEQVLAQLEDVFSDGKTNLIIMIDQLDELFRVHDNEQSRDAALFASLILALSKQSVYPIYVVTSMRSDFVRHCDRYPGLMTAVNDGRFPLEEISRNQLRDIIRLPPSLYGIEVAPRLLGRMVNEIEEEDALMPEIQHMLFRLWLHWRRFGEDRLIDIEHYESIQQMKKAMSFHAEHAMIGMKNDMRWLSKRLFQSLMGFNLEGTLFARPMRLNRVVEITGQPTDKVWSLVEKFRENGRLLIDINGPKASNPLLELTNERAISRWPRLEEWAEEERNRAMVYRRIARAARTWKQGKTPLWLDNKLDDALLWLRQDPPSEAWGKLYDPDFDLAVTFVKESERARRRGESAPETMQTDDLESAVGPQLPPLREQFESKVKEESTSSPEPKPVIVPPAIETKEPAPEKVVTTKPREDLKPPVAEASPKKGPNKETPPAVKRKPPKPATSPKSSSQPKPGKPETKISSRKLGKEDVAEDHEAKTTQKARSKSEGNKKRPQLKSRSKYQVDNNIDPNAHGPTLSARLASMRAAKAAGRSVQNEPPVRSAPPINPPKPPRPPQTDTPIPAQAHIPPRVQEREPAKPPQEGPSFKKTKAGPMKVVYLVLITFLFLFVMFNAFSRWQNERTAREASDIERSRFEAAGYWKDAGLAMDQNNPVKAWHFYARAGKVAHDSTGYTHSSLMNIYSGWGPVFLVSILPHQGLPKTLMPLSNNKLLTSTGTRLLMWNANTGLEYAPMEHNAPVSDMILSPSGDYILSWSEDSSANIFSAQDGSPMLNLQHPDWLLGASFNKDETKVLIHSMDNTARLWSLTGELLTEVLHRDGLRGAEFSPDYNCFLTWDQSGAMQLWDLNGNAMGRLMQHKTPVTKAHFSPDGRRITTFTEGMAATTWEVGTGKRLGKVMNHGREAGGVLLGDDIVLTYGNDGLAKLWQSSDGKLISHLEHGSAIAGAELDPLQEYVITYDFEGTARIWNAAGQQAPASPAIHDGPISGAAFSHEKSMVMTWSEDGSVRLWNFQGDALGPPMWHDGPVTGATFGPGGNHILSYGKDNTARLWRTHDASPLGLPMVHSGPVDNGFFMPDGKTCVTQSSLNDVRVWAIMDNRTVREPLTHEDRIDGVTIRPDSKMAVTYSKDGSAGMWRLPSGELLAWLDHGYPVRNAIFDKTGKILATYSDGGSVQMWDAEEGRPIGEALIHESPVDGAEFSDDSSQLLSYSGDGLVLVADKNGQAGPRLAHEGPVARAAFDKSGKFIISLVVEEAARSWGSKNGKLKSTMNHAGISDFEYNQKTDRIYTWGSDGNVIAWKPGSDKKRWTLPHGAAVTGLIIHEETRQLATFGEDGKVRIWHLDTGDEIGPQQLIVHQAPVEGAAFRPDGQQLLVWSDDGKATLWEVSTGSSLFTYQHEGWVMGAEYGPSGNPAMTFSMDGTARLLDTTRMAVTGQAMYHDFPIEKAIFNEAGNLSLTYSMDGTARLWHSVDGSLAFPPMRHEGSVTGAEFSPDERFVITTGSDGAARVWDIGADYDFPKEHLSLLVEVATGTQIGNGGALTVMGSETWHRQKTRYMEIAREQSKQTLFPEKNLYQKQSRFWNKENSSPTEGN